MTLRGDIENHTKEKSESRERERERENKTVQPSLEKLK